MNDRILSLLGICKRAGKLITGADTTIDVLFLAESAAEAEYHIVIGKSELSSHLDSIVSINVFGLEYVKLH